MQQKVAPSSSRCSDVRIACQLLDSFIVISDEVLRGGGGEGRKPSSI